MESARASGALASFSNRVLIVLRTLALGAACALTASHQAWAASDAPASLAGRQVSGFAELLLPSGPTSPADDAALSAALDAYARQAQPDDLGDLEGYLAAHPTSPWRVWIDGFRCAAPILHSAARHRPQGACSPRSEP